VFLYSVGKDSAVMLHIALKAFYPAPPPFPFLHIASGWDFRDLLELRDRQAAKYGLNLIVHHNAEAAAQGIDPINSPTPIYSQLMLTDALKAALDAGGFDAAFGGGRRDEEKSRAKERIFSFRTATHNWDPKNQRPELWNLYNARKKKGESIRVFPLSNWTELDIWQYILAEGIEIVPLYYAATRPTVERDGLLLVVDDDRMPLLPGETPQMRMIRFRTLGCYPLTAAVESTAATIDEVVYETLSARTSERAGRMIDYDKPGSMEQKKIEGYF
jgi:sulfate adenylyltransferase subunit 2